MIQIKFRAFIVLLLIPEIRLLYNSIFPFLKDDQELWDTQSVLRRFHVFTNLYFISPSQDRSAFPWLLAIPELGEWFWQARGLRDVCFLGLAPNLLHCLSFIISWGLLRTQLRMLRPCEMVESTRGRRRDPQPSHD